jgi:hypothetical protein
MPRSLSFTFPLWDTAHLNSTPLYRFVLQVYRKAAVTGTALRSFSSAPRPMNMGMHDTPLQSAAQSGVVK